MRPQLEATHREHRAFHRHQIQVSISTKRLKTSSFQQVMDVAFVKHQPLRSTSKFKCLCVTEMYETTQKTIIDCAMP